MLVFAIILAFIFPKTNIVQYDLQISAGLFILLYILKRYILKGSSYSRLAESVVFTLIVLGIVNSTGGLSSPFFFLVYFLLFSLSLILEPVISITTTLALIVFYLFSLPQGVDLKSLLPIISMAFLTPFAMYLGQEKIRNDQLKAKTEHLEENTLLFLSLMLKNHLHNIKDAADNFMGDHELGAIRKSVSRMEKLIEKYEKEV